MAGKKGLKAKLGAHQLDQLHLQDMLLAYIREGYSRKDACELIDIDPSTLWRYCQKHPEFLSLIQDAEAEIVEAAYAVFIKIMNDEEAANTDRLSAADKLAKYKARDQKNDHKIVEHQHKHTVEIGGDMLDEVLAMQERLALNRGDDVIDVEGEEH